MSDLERRLRERVHREGPIPFDRFMEAALYDEDGGFFAGGGGAGRQGGDFVTSPETGSLYGALVARFLDRCWERLGRPDPFVVVDAGAGRGQLCRDVLRAAPQCAPALRYVMVERSAALRARHHEHLLVEPPDEALGPAARTGEDDEPEPVPGTGPIVTSAEALPTTRWDGVVVANELLDNLPFRVVERGADGWSEVRVGVDDTGFVEVPVPADPDLVPAHDVPPGTRLPVQSGVHEWLHQCVRALRRSVVAVVDYGAEAAEFAGRHWLRTYRAHDRGGSPLTAVGHQDVTADVVLDDLRAAARREGFAVDHETTQAEWLRHLGIDALVEQARRDWDARAHIGDLDALKARSLPTEAAALTDPAGLGAHAVVVLSR